MRILVAHVAYRLHGGEDAVVATETELLRLGGHDVTTFTIPSSRLQDLDVLSQLSVIASPHDHRVGRQLMRQAVEAHNPEIVHFHNLFPLLGVGAVKEARSLGCATVRTLHNWRLSCLAGTHLLNGCPCHRCSPSRVSAGVLRGCYRDSRTMSQEMARFTRADWRSIQEGVYDRVIVVNDAIRRNYIDAGMDPSIVEVKASSVAPIKAPSSRRSGALYVGRLSEEKGILDLVRKWPEHACPLTVVGSGPLSEDVERAAGTNVKLIGEVNEEGVDAWLRSADVLVMPSLSDEGPPIVLLKALAAETPVVAFDTAAIGPVVRTVSDGLVVPVGDFRQLAHVACACVPYQAELGHKALDAYESRYTHDRNLESLVAIYRSALSRYDR